MIQYSILLVFSVILFLYGFFPLSNNTIKFKNDLPTHIYNTSLKLPDIYPSHFEKTILVVIDALRLDFVTPNLMPLTVGLMNKQGCFNKVSVESPTVTLPRIKALTTGSIPQYIDVVRNLASSEILIDSWLHSAIEKGLRVVFYGDNTWEKLFPGFFTRSKGTTSFFVWDFTEVDNNVTRNAEVELKRKDWDVMILHYLGLDHIGHVLGPFSSRITLKLKEMDGVIYNIHEKTASESKTLILVTGDHGMRDSGGHGGTSHPEITVPLISIGLNCQNSSFLQTDVPANLAILLGLKIPSTSIGQIQKSLLHSLNLQQYLYALRYNTELLLQKKPNCCEEIFNKATYFHEKCLKENDTKYGKVAEEMYQRCSTAITKELYEASSRQVMSSVLVAILVMTCVLVMLLNAVISDNAENHTWKVLSFFIIVFTQFFVAFDIASFTFMFVLVIILGLEFKKLLNYVKIAPFSNSLDNFLVLTSILHPISFISTSFIEEEHYFWIFFSITLVIMLVLHGFSCINTKVPQTKDIKLLIVLFCIRFAMDINSTIENSVQNTENWSNWLNQEENLMFHQMFFIFGLFLIFCTLYKHCFKSKITLLSNLLTAVTLISIFLLKSTAYHNTFLGKLIWTLILIQNVLPKDVSLKNICILSTTLLIKPHNVVLIPFAVFSASHIINLDRLKNIPNLSIANLILSNCFYFLQGHRNSLATVDISVGYTGLNDYYPLLVISQVLIHTYTFQILFHLVSLGNITKYMDQKKFFMVLLALRCSVMLFTCVVTIIFRHHLFIWSVFAPKLFIESVHTGVLLLEVLIWYIFEFLKKIWLLQKGCLSMKTKSKFTT